MLFSLKDGILENMPKKEAEKFSQEFMALFQGNKDYSKVARDLLKWALLDLLLPKITQEGKVFDDVRAALKQSASALGKGAADRSAAYRASCAAANVADAYANDDVAAADADAARNAAHAARNAAYAAEDDASACADRAAAYAVYAVRAAAYATDDAYEEFADKLIELMKEV